MTSPIDSNNMTNVIDDLDELYADYYVEQPYSVVQAKPIDKPFWNFESSIFQWLTDTRLCLTLEYIGSYRHPFEVSILDTSTENNKKFTIIFKDTVTNDRKIGRQFDNYAVELEKYVQPGTTFKILRVNGDFAVVLGEAVYPK